MTQIPYTELNSIKFSVLGSEENERDSYINVIHQDLFRNGVPHPSGLYDAHMGTTEHAWNCESCQNGKQNCPGHFGSLMLNYPVPSPMFIKDIIKWLKIVCFACGKLIINYVDLGIPRDKILGEYVKMIRAGSSGKRNLHCVHCDAIHPHVIKDKNDNTSIVIEIYRMKSVVSKTPTKSELVGRENLYPHYIKVIFEKITPETVTLLGKPVENHPRKFLLTCLRVPPNTIRPDVKKINAGRSNSNDLTILLQTIIKNNEQIPRNIPAVVTPELAVKIHNLCLTVYELIKGTSSTSKRSIVSTSKKPLIALTKRWPRKYGRIRRNLNGRRANHMGRSFITGDPFRKINEVGVPISIARSMQMPIVVQDDNFDECLMYFMNGLQRYPGCTKIRKRSTGSTHWLGRIKDDFQLERGDIIYRDVIDGDIVGFNRQPTLLPSSFSAMRCEIMETGDTIRLNVIACNLFNADFDGDAMNLIFPRSARTCNEIWEMSSPGQFFISYQNGNPSLGQSHDSVVGMAKLTTEGTVMDKYHAMRLFSQTNVYPSIEARQYEGREIISMYLRESGNHINLTAKPSSYQEIHANFRRYNPKDIRVEINRGELKCGILDKSTIGEGASSGLYHTIHNQYGPDAALDACFYMQQIANSFLYNHGFTINIEDLILRNSALTEIHKIEESLIAESIEITNRLNQGKIIAPIGKTLNEYYEELQINALRPDDAFWQHILSSIDPENNHLYQSVITGTKGKLFNLKNTVCAIGQVEINGERMRENFGRRSLPYFTKDDPNPMARGYVPDSYIVGLALPSMFFHAMEARYALINRALSTAITGSYNRMAVKNLEAIVIDNRRRAMNGERVTQILYGSDGADPRFIEYVRLPTMAADLTDEAFEKEFNAAGLHTGGKFAKILAAEFEQLKVDRAFYIDLQLNLEVTADQPYTDRVASPINPNRIIEDTLYNLDEAAMIDIDIIEAVEKVRRLCDEIPYCLLNNIQKERETPIPEYLRESCTMLCIVIRSFLNVATLTRRGVSVPILDLIVEKIKNIYSQSLVSYGKNIGIITSQNLSEPMTQMVLDSHHSSGAGGVKKKGMFRIKEILTATPTHKMKSPSMILHVLSEFRNNKIKVQEIANHIEMLPFRQFVSVWQIFFERYGEPIHPAYKNESKMIRDFSKYHIHLQKPSDLTHWCIRIVLDKIKLIEKQMKVETIYHKIMKEFPFVYVVYATDNADNIVIRIYLRNNFSKKGNITTLKVTAFVEELQNLIIRGIDGIKAAYVLETNLNEKQNDGTVKKEKMYYIMTNGTNLARILENPYIDPDTVRSDSVVEMQTLFGVTTARNRIISELKGQISGFSHRHYALYADEMTYSGVATAIDRYGSAKRNASVLLRISDASPISVIEEASINSFSDNLSGISPSIILGKNPRSGDLFNRFKLDENFVAENIVDLDKLLENI